MSNNNTNYEITQIKDDILGNKDEKVHKVIVVGDSGVGKTSLSIMATKGLFNSQSRATVGFDIFNYAAQINNEITIKLQIWDTCGLEEFNSCTTNLYKEASLAIIVYAINDYNSFNNIQKWANLVKKHASPEVLIFVVGNKTDLENDRKVAKEAGEQMIKDCGFGYFAETSAKDNIFVQELFKEGIIQLFELYKKYQNNNQGSKREDFVKRKLTESRHKNNNNRKKCC